MHRCILDLASTRTSTQPVAFSLFNTAHGPGHTGVWRVGLLDRSAGSKTDPIEMTVIDRRALCAVDLGRYEYTRTVGSTVGERGF